MRVCPRCQTRYDDVTRFCPRDGASLGTPEADARVGQVLMGQFRLLEICGRGAMGTVYRAWQLGMEREVAVKMLRTDVVRDPGVVKRFQREARSVARLSHPNVVTVYLVGETEDQVPYLVMEFVTGTPLSVELARGERILPARALRIARQIALALAEAHGKGIIHRDLKPANILLSQRPREGETVKVLDFGIAKIVGGDEREPAISALTRTGTIFGTPHYLSPEQAQGIPVDARADLYALGVILYHMLAGRLPFDGTGMVVVLAHVNATPPPLQPLVPDLDPRVEALVTRLLAKDPAARPQTAELLAAELEAMVAQLDGAPAAMPRLESSPVAVTVKATALPAAMFGAHAAKVIGGAAASAAPAPNLGATMAPSSIPGAHPLASVPVPVAAAAPQPQVPHAATVMPVVPAPHSAPISAPVPMPVAPAPSAPVAMPPPGQFGGSSVVDATIPPPSREVAVPMVPAAETNVGVATGSLQAAMPPPSASQTADVWGLGESEMWRPPVSPWRRVIVGGLLLVAVGGAAAGGVYAWKKSQDGGGGGEAAAAPVPAGEGGAGGAAAAGDGGAVAVVAAAPDAAVLGPESPSQYRVVTLGERGWAVRALVPPQLVINEAADLVFEAWDPAGAPATTETLRVLIEEPTGVERAVTCEKVPGRDGRYALTRQFRVGGVHKVTVFPAGSRSDVAVWFDLEVRLADGTLPAAKPAKQEKPKKPPKKKGGKGGGKTGAGGSGGGDDGDPYHILDEGGGAGGGGGKDPPKDPPPKDPPKDPAKDKEKDKGGGGDVELE